LAACGLSGWRKLTHHDASVSGDELCSAVVKLLIKIANCQNKEICHELYSYVWDISGALSLLNCYVKWLALGNFPQNTSSYTEGSYTCKRIDRHFSMAIFYSNMETFQGLARAGRRHSCQVTRNHGSLEAALLRTYSD